MISPDDAHGPFFFFLDYSVSIRPPKSSPSSLPPKSPTCEFLFEPINPDNKCIHSLYYIKYFPCAPTNQLVSAVFYIDYFQKAATTTTKKSNFGTFYSISLSCSTFIEIFEKRNVAFFLPTIFFSNFPQYSLMHIMRKEMRMTEYIQRETTAREWNQLPTNQILPSAI